MVSVTSKCLEKFEICNNEQNLVSYLYIYYQIDLDQQQDFCYIKDNWINNNGEKKIITIRKNEKERIKFHKLENQWIIAL